MSCPLRWHDLKTATLGLIVARDISARIRAEEDLKRSELRYRALFEDSPISLWEEDFSRLKRHFDQLKKDRIQIVCPLFRRPPRRNHALYPHDPDRRCQPRNPCAL